MMAKGAGHLKRTGDEHERISQFRLPGTTRHQLERMAQVFDRPMAAFVREGVDMLHRAYLADPPWGDPPAEDEDDDD